MLPLILKALAFGLSLFLFNYFGGFLGTVIFLAVSFGLYFKRFFQWRDFFFSFLFLVIYAFVLGNFLGEEIYLWVGILFFSALFGILLGIKNLVFINRKRALNLFSGAMYFIVALSFFIADKSSAVSFLFYTLLSLGAFYFIFKEAFKFLMPEFSSAKRNLVAISLGFIIIELMSIIMFLPLGFLNATALIILFIFVFEDLIMGHIQGRLTRQMILNNITALLIFTIIIFALSKWTP